MLFWAACAAFASVLHTASSLLTRKAKKRRHSLQAVAQRLVVAESCTAGGGELSCSVPAVKF